MVPLSFNFFFIVYTIDPKNQLKRKENKFIFKYFSYIMMIL